jgi:Protein of unknown function (DUF2752)
MNEAAQRLAGVRARDMRPDAAPLRRAFAEEEARDAGRLRRARLVLSLTSAIFAVSAAWRPSELPGVVLCPFRALTGLPCPGCGMTRAFCSIGHGELYRAFVYNALAPFVFVAALLLWAHALSTLVGLDPARRALERLRPTPRAARVMLAVTLLWWVARLYAGL